MSDQISEIKNVGLGSRLGSALKGLVGGLVMIVVSFGVLYYNEGRAVRAGNLVKKAAAAPTVDATKPDTGNNGRLVAATGVLTADEQLNDAVVAGQFNGIGAILALGDYIRLDRKVEMYAWHEEKKTESTKNAGGSETQKVTFTYTKEWTAKPQNSSQFKEPAGHINTLKAVDDDTQVATGLKVGGLALNSESLELPQGEAVTLSKDNVELLSGTPERMLTNRYIFLGTGSLEAPQVGDVRVSYYAVPAGKDATVFGKLAGAEKLEPFVDAKNGTLYRAFFGTREQAVQEMKSENTMFTWILRVVGFLLMWFGLMSLFGPLTTVMDVLPIAGSLGRGLVAIVSLVAALVVSGVIILVGMIAHNIFATLAVALVALVIVGMVVKKMIKK